MDTEEDEERLNILFFAFTSTFLGTFSLFWVDFIPGFGMQPNVSNFLPQWVHDEIDAELIIMYFDRVAFNLRCIFGASTVCGAATISLAWCRMLAKTTSFVMAALVLLYGEGANFYALINVHELNSKTNWLKIVLYATSAANYVSSGVHILDIVQWASFPVGTGSPLEHVAQHRRHLDHDTRHRPLWARVSIASLNTCTKRYFIIFYMSKIFVHAQVTGGHKAKRRDWRRLTAYCFMR